MENELSKQAVDYKYKVKEQKHTIQELLLKLKHCEHRLLQKDDYY
jgi:hypothetical protein